MGAAVFIFGVPEGGSILLLAQIDVEVVESRLRGPHDDDERSNDKSEEDQYGQRYPQLAPSEPATPLHVSPPPKNVSGPPPRVAN